MINVNAYLNYYWPLNNNYNDIVSGATLTNPTQVSFSFDRLNRANSALYLNKGFMNVPAIYLNTDYTISAWIKLLAFSNNNQR